eukprot:6175546-Pleurochrysis_carterae.AAC.1
MPSADGLVKRHCGLTGVCVCARSCLADLSQLLTDDGRIVFLQACPSMRRSPPPALIAVAIDACPSPFGSSTASHGTTSSACRGSLIGERTFSLIGGKKLCFLADRRKETLLSHLHSLRFSSC